MAEKHTTLAQLRLASLRAKTEMLAMLVEALEGVLVNVTITLPAGNWSGGAQTIQSSSLLADSDYWYLVSVDPASFSASNGKGIRADDITTDGQITFHCDSTPGSNLTINIIRLEVEISGTNTNVGKVLNLIAGSGDMATSVYDPDGRETDIFAFAENILSRAFIDHSVSDVICDNSGNPILDNAGNTITSTIICGDMSFSVYDPKQRRLDVYAFAEGLVQQVYEHIENIVNDIYEEIDGVRAYADNLVKKSFDELYDSLLIDHAIYRTICDSDGNAILDSDGDDIAGRIAIQIM